MNRVCLIGEDSLPVIHLLRTYVAFCGYKPAIATVGERVLELAQEGVPAVIVLNTELPGKVRGWEVLEALKGDAAMRQIPVIAFWLEPEGRDSHSASMADASLPMPMNFGAFREAVEALASGGPGVLRGPPDTKQKE